MAHRFVRRFMATLAATRVLARPLPSDLARRDVGNRRPFVGALVALDEGSALDPGSEAARAVVEAAIDTANAQLSRYEHIRRFQILPRDLTVEDGELTPTLKVRRHVVEEHFANHFEALYS